MVHDVITRISVLTPTNSPPGTHMHLTPDDIQNLCACARQSLAPLTTENLALMAQALKRAEADMAEMRRPVLADAEPAPIAP